MSRARIALRVRWSLALALALALAPVASAQAALRSGAPAPNGHADAGLAYVEVRFTGAVDPAFTSLDVVGVADLASRANGAVRIDADEPSVARVPVAPLTDGYYFVTWRTLSVDGQTAHGAFEFAVGNATLKFPGPAPARDASETPPFVVAKEAFARAVALAGVALAVGVPLFMLVAGVDDPERRRLARVAASFALLGALASGLSLLFLAQRVGADAPATMAWRLLAGRAAALAIAAAALAGVAWRRDLLPLALLVGGAALVATVLGSRAAAQVDDRVLGLLAQTLLLAGLALAAGAGIGTMLTRGRARGLLLAGLALTAIAAAYEALRDVPAASDIISAYGVALLALALALALALVRRPAVAAVALVAMLAAAGTLAAATAPDRAVEAGLAIPRALELTNASATTHVVLDVTPRPVAGNATRIDVALHPLTTSDVPNGTTVALSIQGPHDAAPRDVPIAQTSPGEWSTGDGSFFTEAGRWHLSLTVHRPDETAELGFDAIVEEAPA